MIKPPKIKGYSTGGTVADLNPDQQNEYNALTTPEAKAAYLKAGLDLIKGMASKGASQMITTGGAQIVKSGGAQLVGATAKTGVTAVAPVAPAAAVPWSALGELGAAGVESIGTHTGEDSSIRATNIGASALKGAGYGAAVGSVVPVIGTAIGAGVGALAGGIKGWFDSEGDIKNRNSNAVQKIQAEVSKKQGIGTYGMNQTSQLAADGGLIIGPGTTTSDSIATNLEENSFVVPAMNAKKAMNIRKTYLS